jgi:3-hydroxyisobutyrate dehydrogenase-like beta-hydroxyacid dehydrogenase
MTKIAFLGLGAMGSRMAARLVAAGYTVSVWNRTAQATQLLVEQGARGAASPAEAVAEAGFVLSMVRDDDASRTVWKGSGGALAAMRDDAVAMECSTLSLGWTRELAALMAHAGRAFLDAPVAGSRPQAEAGELIFLVGGATDHVRAAEPLLNAMGKAVHHAGANGAGTAAKLVVNAALAVQAAWIGETVGTLGKAGLDAERIFAAALQTPVFGPAAHGLTRSVLTGSFAPLFPVELAEKDLGYALSTASAEMPVTDAARSVFAEAIASGHGGEHLTAVVRLFDTGPAS